MAYDEKLDRRIKKLAASIGIGTSKKMFGGTCCLLGGNMVFGVYGDFLILRLGKNRASEYLEKPFTRPFDITGKPMRGWVMVEQEAVAEDAALMNMLEDARQFAAGLPPK